MNLLWFVIFMALKIDDLHGKSLGTTTENELLNPPNETLVNKVSDKVKLMERQFGICEQFNETKDSDVLHLHGNGITVVTRLES